MAKATDRTLPTGMRDVLPEDTRTRRRLSRRLERAVSLHGFELVTLPAFEFESVLERGLGRLAREELLRFVEPETGESAAFRPDMTPQVARLVATRLRERPPPLRIAYEGTVLRRRGTRATSLAQFGVELVGPPHPQGDVELLEVAAAALRAAGVQRFTLDVGDSAILRSLMEGLPAEQAEALGDAFARRDESEVRNILQTANKSSSPLEALVRIAGGADAVSAGVAALQGTPAEPYARRLASLFEEGTRRGLPLSVDFGEVRGWAYYTGMRVHAYADGAARSVGGGGRYDELLRGFGRPLAAVGFSIDLDELRVAVAAQSPAERRPPRVVVVGDRAATELLRARGVPAIDHDDAAAGEIHARAWGFSHLLVGGTLRELATGAAIAWNASAASSLVTDSNESGA